MLPRSGRPLVILPFAFVVLCGHQSDMPVGPPSCCGDCLYVSLCTEAFLPEMLLGFLVSASAGIVSAQACTCDFLGLLLKSHPNVPFNYFFR